MSRDAIPALEAERAEAMALIASLSASEWELPSDCAGWRVQDVITHMASVFQQIADPGSMPASTSEDAEENAELGIADRKTWTPAQVSEAYDHWSTVALGALAGLQEPPMADTVVPLGNLGSHPLHLLANALVFDHYCHLRHDLLQPHGPLVRPALPVDDLRLVPTMTWMLAGLPQMCAAGFAGADRAVNLVFEGPGGGSWVLTPAAPVEPFMSVVPGSDPNAAATVTTTAHDFVCWGTDRRDWRVSGVQVTGDADYAARILDAVNVI
jgi:hypothetical protein